MTCDHLRALLIAGGILDGWDFARSPEPCRFCLESFKNDAGSEFPVFRITILNYNYISRNVPTPNWFWIIVN